MRGDLGLDRCWTCRRVRPLRSTASIRVLLRSWRGSAWSGWPTCLALCSTCRQRRSRRCARSCWRPSGRSAACESAQQTRVGQQPHDHRRTHLFHHVADRSLDRILVRRLGFNLVRWLPPEHAAHSRRTVQFLVKRKVGRSHEGFLRHVQLRLGFLPTLTLFPLRIIRASHILA